MSWFQTTWYNLNKPCLSHGTTWHNLIPKHQISNFQPPRRCFWPWLLCQSQAQGTQGICGEIQAVGRSLQNRWDQSISKVSLGKMKQKKLPNPMVLLTRHATIDLMDKFLWGTGTKHFPSFRSPVAKHLSQQTSSTTATISPLAIPLSEELGVSSLRHLKKLLRAEGKIQSHQTLEFQCLKIIQYQ